MTSSQVGLVFVTARLVLSPLLKKNAQPVCRIEKKIVSLNKNKFLTISI
jgi:hypothetical protein